jgi:hypothetical protein
MEKNLAIEFVTRYTELINDHKSKKTAYEIAEYEFKNKIKHITPEPHITLEPFAVFMIDKSACHFIADDWIISQETQR